MDKLHCVVLKKLKTIFTITSHGESKLRWTGERLKGIVRWFNYEKGYEFITPDGRRHNVYVHSSRIRFEGIWTLGLGEGRGRGVPDLTSLNSAFNVTGPGQSDPKGSFSGLSYCGKRVGRGGVGFGGSAKKIKIHE